MKTFQVLPIEMRKRETRTRYWSFPFRKPLRRLLKLPVEAAFVQHSSARAPVEKLTQMAQHPVL